MKYHFKISEPHLADLYKHLFPGDGKEAVAIAVCGRRIDCKEESFYVHNILLIPHGECTRTDDYIKWNTSIIAEILPELLKKNQALFKIVT